MNVLPLGQVSPFGSLSDSETQLARLVRKSANTLLTISSVFPFELFPDVLIIDENKVGIIHRNSWFSEHVHSVFIEDVTEVSVEKNMFLATLRVVDGRNLRFPLEYVIRKLNIREALEARKLIEGLVVAKRQKIDLSKVDIKKVISQMENIGSIRGLR